MEHISKNIKQLRQKRNWNQSEVAKQLNISTPAFSKIETGITDVNFSRLSQIGQLFEVPLSRLLLNQDDQQLNGSIQEIEDLKEKLYKREEEILKLQSLLIELYEEVRKK